MTQIILTILGSTALAAVINNLFDIIKGKGTLKKALQILLLANLKKDGQQYIAEGHISAEELQEYREAFDVYKKLGGNGYADDVYARVKALPFEP